MIPAILLIGNSGPRRLLGPVYLSRLDLQSRTSHSQSVSTAPSPTLTEPALALLCGLRVDHVQILPQCTMKSSIKSVGNVCNGEITLLYVSLNPLVF